MSKPQSDEWYERRRQIMEAALPVFAEKGFKGATNRDIAERAAIAPGLIYHYFASKEDLFNAILEEFVPFNRVNLPLETMTNVPPQQLLPLLIQGLGAILQEPKFFLVIRILVAETMYSSEAESKLNSIFKRLIDPLTTYMQAQIAQGQLRAADPLLMAQMFVGSFGVFVLRRVVMHDPTLLTYNVEAIARFAVEAFLRAFAPEGG
jgi:AcrR family transcriptional regulator